MQPVFPIVQFRDATSDDVFLSLKQKFLFLPQQNFKTMKKLLLIALLIVATFQLSAQDLLVGTYNIRYKNRNDSVDGYDYIGVGREDGVHGGEHEAIFYKKDKIKLLDHGDFWLSETPDKPGLGWDAVCIRVCTWGKFGVQAPKMRHGIFNRRKNDTQRVFYYFNLHMDHVGVVARREAAKLVVARVREIAQGHPVILTGDFNVDQNNEIYTIFTHSGLLKDSYETARVRFAENGTFNNFKTDLYSTSRIDHVFVSPTITVNAYGVLTDSYWTPDDTEEALKGTDVPQEITFDKYIRHNPSDHYPVFVKIKL